MAKTKNNTTAADTTGATVRRIQSRDFAVTTPPEAAICKECDLKILYNADGIIRRSVALA